MSFPGRLEHTFTLTRTHNYSHINTHVCVHGPLELPAHSDYKPWEYLSRGASRSYQELHATQSHLLILWSYIAMVTISSYTHHQLHRSMSSLPSLAHTAQMFLVGGYLGCGMPGHKPPAEVDKNQSRKGTGSTRRHLLSA